MKREIGIDRLYFLGEYKNIRFTDRFLGIPEEHALNPELIAKLSYILMVTIELEYRKYIELNTRLHGFDLGEAIGALQQIRSDAYDELQQLLNGEIEDSKQEVENE